MPPGEVIWNRNVVSLGLSSGFVEPLESTSIHLIQSGIVKLLALFPDKRFNPVERGEYNRQMQEVFEDVRDFVILHYKATRRDDSGFWDYCRTMEVPDSLARKMELWRVKGRVFRQGAELFATASWVAVMLGQGMVPDEHEPAADALPDAHVTDMLDKMRLSYLRMAEQMPRHDEFIRDGPREVCPFRDSPQVEHQLGGLQCTRSAVWARRGFVVLRPAQLSGWLEGHLGPQGQQLRGPQLFV